MEEEKGTSAASQPLSAEAQRKHAAMFQRLSERHQSNPRLATSDSSPHSFLSHFSLSKQSIERDLLRLRSSPPFSISRSDLAPISSAIVDLDKLLAENSFCLPSYDLRSALNSISDLKHQLQSINLQLLPRKKFSFKNKPPTSAASNNDLNASAATEESGERSRIAVRESPGLRDEVGRVLVRRLEGSGDSDFTLANLASCEVRLKGRARALYVHRLRNCQVFAGPVTGSILIEEVEGCVFMLASHQIRIHRARVTDFYLRVRSRPIVEECEGVRFAPYDLVYEGIEEELRECGLGEDSGNWANVDDFKWLRAVQSPNWCVLPAQERVRMVDISDPGNSEGI